MNQLFATIKDFFTRKNKEFEVGQYIYNSNTGRVALVEYFNKEKRKMKVRHRHNITCEYSDKEINEFKPYFGMINPEEDGGYEDGYIDTIYGTENQCDKLIFVEE